MYSPEIFSQDRLRKVLKAAIRSGYAEEPGIAASTLQRMVDDYLKRRKYSHISFTQSDLNARPNCKTLSYAVLRYHHEWLIMHRELSALSQKKPPPVQSDQDRFDILSDEAAAKRFQEDECVGILKVHNSRDGRIQNAVKKLSDYFREVENKYRKIVLSQEHLQEASFWSDGTIYRTVHVYLIRTT